MLIKKDFRVSEFASTEMSNAPFTVKLSLARSWERKISELSMRKEDVEKFFSQPDYNLAGKLVECSFQTKEVVVEKDGNLLYSRKEQDLSSNDLMFKKLYSLQEVDILHSLPPQKNIKDKFFLEVSSFGGGDGVHMHILECPFYTFTVELTESEYAELKQSITPYTVFSFSMRVKNSQDLEE